jgi:outer membrane biosynthesis protein TonB
MKGKNIDPKAAIISIGGHLLLLVICLFIGYSLPATPAPIEEMGMEVNLGSSDDGSGVDQPFSSNNPSYQPEAIQKSNVDNADESIPKELATDEKDLDAPMVNSTLKPNKNQKDKTNPNTKPLAQQKPKILFPANNGKGGNGANINQEGGSEGNGNGNGDKGVVGGTAGASNYSGIPGNGTGGVGHSFSDRNMVAKPKPDAEFKEGGKVVVRVTVNKEGQIIAKRIKSQANSELGKIALEKINEIRFSKSETAPPEQFGDITFVFKTRVHK